jgi:hypothetical protein
MAVKFPQLSHNVRSLGCFMPLSLKLVCGPAGRRSTVITLLAQLLNVNHCKKKNLTSF